MKWSVGKKAARLQFPAKAWLHAASVPHRHWWLSCKWSPAVRKPIIIWVRPNMGQRSIQIWSFCAKKQLMNHQISGLPYFQADPQRNSYRPWIKSLVRWWTSKLLAVNLHKFSHWNCHKVGSHHLRQTQVTQVSYYCWLMISNHHILIIPSKYPCDTP